MSSLKYSDMDSGLGDAIEAVQAINTVVTQADQELIPQEKQEIGNIINDTAQEEDTRSNITYNTQSNESEGALTSFFASCSINLLLPFINGIMLGFGEILAHEIGFRYGWFFAKVSPPRRMAHRRVGVPQSTINDASILL